MGELLVSGRVYPKQPDVFFTGYQAHRHRAAFPRYLSLGLGLGHPVGLNGCIRYTQLPSLGGKWNVT